MAEGDFMAPQPNDVPSIERLATVHSIGEALELAVAFLRKRTGSPAAATPALDAQVVLAYVAGMPRAMLLAHPERDLSQWQAAQFADLMRRRLAGEPVAYLVGHREFYGLELMTDARALIPRPETELLVEAALAALRDKLRRRDPQPSSLTRLVAADIGTGTGAIALALAAQEPCIDLVYGVDISADALALARENAQRLGPVDRVRFLQGDLLAPLPEPVDLLLANLPYVAPHETPSLPEEVHRYEPDLALYADEGGLSLLRRFFAEAPAKMRPQGIVGVEFGYDQRGAVESLARTAFPGATIRVGTDYAGWDRFALVAT